MVVEFTGGGEARGVCVGPVCEGGRRGTWANCHSKSYGGYCPVVICCCLRCTEGIRPVAVGPPSWDSRVVTKDDVFVFPGGGGGVGVERFRNAMIRRI